ncbi:MAG: hypothetical protein FD138_1046 [Planctomycetota bacterium]|nr:MAG: hypothetical protein FD138_1046 [Planctomycetota bacterium]
MTESRKPKTLIQRLGEYRMADYFAGAGLLAVVIFVGLLFLPIESQREVGHRPFGGCKNNLKQIGLALHNYHDQYKTFPPAFILGPNGRPWHSWRVLLLPFLNEEKLYAEYRFDEPWNGPHNSLLSKRRPDVFVCPMAKKHLDLSHTTYVAAVGAETAWSGEEPIEFNDISDSASNTVLVFEVRDARIPWLAPDDLAFDEACVVPSRQSGRRPSSFSENGVYVLLCDGAVRLVSLTIDPVIWRALLTRDGCETVNDF